MEKIHLWERLVVWASYTSPIVGASMRPSVFSERSEGSATKCPWGTSPKGNNMKSILITGDIHGESDRFARWNFLEYYYNDLKNSDKRDNVIIVCGDFGFI